MYAEQFNIQNPSDLVESAAKWVQWAMVGSLAGGSKEAEVRYNLNQFWQTKAAVYNTANALDRGNLERLDVMAHGIWDALETGKIFSSAPDFMDYLTAYALGGTPLRSGAIQAAAADSQAIAGQKAAAQRAAAFPGQATFSTVFTQYADQNARNLPGVVSSADSIWKQAGVNFLGVPLWAWGLGAAGLVILIASGRR
jgi:hypothetical protein